MLTTDLKKMTLIVLSFIAVLLALLVARVGYFNATGDTGIKILTGTIGGLAAALALLTAGLKGEKGRESFTVFVPVNNKTFQLAHPEPPNLTASRTLQIIRYCYPQIIIDGKLIQIVPTPDKENIVSELADGLQYRIVSDVEQLNSTNTPINYQTKGEGVTVIPSSSRPEWTEDLQNVAFIELQTLLENPQLANNPFELRSWKEPILRHLRLPKGTKLTISSDKNSRYITITKPNFFTLTVHIEYSGVGNGLPLGFENKDSVDYSLYTYSVTCDYQFEQITANSPSTEQYKRWVKWIATSLRERNTVYIKIPPGAKEIFDSNNF